MTAKTPAQRQASRKARLQAAGLVRFSRWVHADDVQALREYAAELQQARQLESSAKFVGSAFSRAECEAFDALLGGLSELNSLTIRANESK